MDKAPNTETDRAYQEIELEQFKQFEKFDEIDIEDIPDLNIEYVLKDAMQIKAIVLIQNLYQKVL